MHHLALKNLVYKLCTVLVEVLVALLVFDLCGGNNTNSTDITRLYMPTLYSSDFVLRKCP